MIEKMESIGANSSAVQLRKLCVHILGPDAPYEVLSSQFRSALQVLSTSTSGQENVRDNEFVVAERIKKLLLNGIKKVTLPIITQDLIIFFVVYRCIVNAKKFNYLATEV